MSLDDIHDLIDKLADAINDLSPLAQVIEAKKKLAECAMWINAAVEADK